MKLFIFSDLHGNKTLFNKMKEYMDNCGDEYFCYCLGDVCDRGPDGYELMKTILSLDNFEYLMGNHEDMFINTCSNYLAFCREEYINPYEYAKNMGFDPVSVFYDENSIPYFQNGGQPTFEAWLRDGCPKDILHKIADLPYAATVNVINGDKEITYELCHSGCHSDDYDCGKFIDEYIWNRTHFITDDKWRNDPNSILVHGHTPIQIISKYVKVPLKRVAPIRYANNTKIDLDVATYNTNIIYLFDVNNDTFIPFYDL